MKKLIEHVSDSFVNHRLGGRGDKLIAAVSGGLDSMVLLHLLKSLARRQGWQLAVAHFNHHLRGQDSDADEKLVVEQARALKLPWTVEAGNVKDHAAAKGISVEMAARELRHGFLARTAARAGARIIALAHHRDDQLELFFLRLFRGSGPQGLAGMQWTSPSPADAALRLVRPLLDVAKDDLLDYARSEGISWREDASNASLEYQRNRIRQELLPLLRREYQPAIQEKVLQTMDMLAAESGVIGELSDTWLAGLTGCTPGLPSYDSLPLAIQRRVIHTQLWRLGIHPTCELVEQLRLTPNVFISVGTVQKLAGAQIRDALDGPLRVRRESQGRVALDQIDRREATWNPRSKTFQTGSKQLHFYGLNLTLKVTSDARGLLFPGSEGWRTERFDADQIGPAFELRFWRVGDRYRPIGMKGDKKLQNCFTDLKVPMPLRHKLVVASLPDGEIFWVEGLRIAERFKVTPDTRRCLVWSWKRA